MMFGARRSVWGRGGAVLLRGSTTHLPDRAVGAAPAPANHVPRSDFKDKQTCWFWGGSCFEVGTLFGVRGIGAKTTPTHFGGSRI